MGLFDSSDEASQDYLKQAMARYQTLGVPSISQSEVQNLPEETLQGTINPQEIQAVDQDPSAYNNISLDPQSRQAQMNALAGYQDIADSGGLDAHAKLGIQQTIDAANTQSRGAQGAIQQQAQAMGQGGGDFALTQRAIAAQGASNNAATQGMQMAAEAEANREAALSGLSSIGGSINSSDFNQASTKAAAQNAINASNQGYKNSANVGNVANNLSSQITNVGNAQNVNANNAAAKQSQVYYNANLPQQQFNNEMAKINGMAGVANQQSAAANQASSNNSAMGGKLLGTAGTIVGGIYGGPAGAAVGGAAGSAVGSQMGKNNNASAGMNAAHGGVACYAVGGVPHDHGICMKMGGQVGGEPIVPGDSAQNDTVPAMLSPGELVIPRSVPKDGPHMEAFARSAPVGGDTKKRVDLTSFTKGYKRGR